MTLGRYVPFVDQIQLEMIGDGSPDQTVINKAYPGN